MLIKLNTRLLATVEPAKTPAHVFIIVLENEGFDKTFGTSSDAPFLSKTLTKRGVLLTQYFGTGHASLDNYIAMISGQAATVEDIYGTDTHLGFAGQPGTRWILQLHRVRYCDDA